MTFVSSCGIEAKPIPLLHVPSHRARSDLSTVSHSQSAVVRATNKHRMAILNRHCRPTPISIGQWPISGPFCWIRPSSSEMNPGFALLSISSSKCGCFNWDDRHDWMPEPSAAITSCHRRGTSDVRLSTDS
jgi:hypothetical protein